MRKKIKASPKLARIKPASIRLPADTEAALLKTEAYKEHGLAYSAAVAINEYLGIPPPQTPAERKGQASRLADAAINRNARYQREHRARVKAEKNTEES